MAKSEIAVEAPGMARRDEGAYCGYVTEEQRRQAGCLGREIDRLNHSRALTRGVFAGRPASARSFAGGSRHRRTAARSARATGGKVPQSSFSRGGSPCRRVTSPICRGALTLQLLAGPLESPTSSAPSTIQSIARLFGGALQRSAGLLCGAVDALAGPLHGTRCSSIAVASGGK